MYYQREDTDCTELFFAHRIHRNHRNSLIYKRFLWLIFNRFTQTGLDDSIVYHPETVVFATVLLESLLSLIKFAKR